MEAAGDLNSFAGVGAKSLISMGTTENSGRSFGDCDFSAPSGPVP